MKFRILPFIAIAAAAGFAQAEPEPPEGFRALFNGKDLTGWGPHSLAAAKGDPAAEAKAKEEFAAHWTVENEELVNDGHGAYAQPDQDFGDIEFHIEYKTVAKADSGIYMRGKPQIQIWDYTEEGGKWKLDADKGSGGLWNNSKGNPGKNPLVLADKPFGEWNAFRVRMIGSLTWVWLNDKLVVDGAIWEDYKNRGMPLPATGPIQLQTHGGEIRWRNIFVRELDADEANAMLRGNDDEQGFAPIFDGKSLDGWVGPTDNYEVVDGAIRCKAGKGGTVYRDEEYSDFVARFEVKLPPGGNNGLAIRYPGKGDTAYVGMCELQILDDTADKYKNLDERQFHGSAYGMAAAKRGYQRPVGEWNFQQVTVQGSTIKVELNGVVILDADLGELKAPEGATKEQLKEIFMGGSPHPGKDRASGFFGFAGHGDPVEFRNVSIKKL
ncbi:MAG: hypothetical protein ACI8UO_001714 [Verrucomicrobiales bacterium]|jgi:hypothetical protein